MAYIEEDEGQIPGLQSRVADLCPAPRVGVEVGEDELRRLVREQIGKLEQEEKELLLSLVRQEYTAHKAGADRGLNVLPQSGGSLSGGHGSFKLPPLQLVLSQSDSINRLERADSNGTPHSRELRERSSSKRSISHHPAARMGRVITRTVSRSLSDKTTDGTDDESTTQAAAQSSPLVNFVTFPAEGFFWAKANTNAFGAFIHVGLQSGLTRACLKCLPMVLVAVTIQLIFSTELITNHTPYLDIDSPNRDSICWIPFKYQISAIVIFVSLVCHNIPAMVNAARIVMQATHQDRKSVV